MRSRPAVIAALLALVAWPASLRAQYVDVNQPLHSNMPYTDAVPHSGPGFSSNVYKGGTAYLGGNFMDLLGNVPPDGYYDFTFRTWTTVPEPSTYALTAAGLLTRAAIARRRRAA